MAASLPACLALTYLAPARELQERQRTLRLSIVFASRGFGKVSTGRMWSMVLASCPQMVQVLSASSSCLRRRLNVGSCLAFVLCCLELSIVVPLLVLSLCPCRRRVAPTTAPPEGLGLGLVRWVCVVLSPHTSFKKNWLPDV